MNITIDEFNAVVAGLRTQFRLQKRATMEKNLQIEYLKNQIAERDRVLSAQKDGVKAMEELLEQTRVQLAGCAVAAEGGSPTAKPGDYGWSPSFQAVVDLRNRYDTMKLKQNRRKR